MHNDTNFANVAGGNVGGMDAVLRMGVGLALILAALLMDLDSTAVAVLTFLSVPIVFSSILKWSPLYWLFRINTVNRADDFTLEA